MRGPPHPADHGGRGMVATSPCTREDLSVLSTSSSRIPSEQFLVNDLGRDARAAVGPKINHGSEKESIDEENTRLRVKSNKKRRHLRFYAPIPFRWKAKGRQQCKTRAQHRTPTRGGKTNCIQ